MKKRIGISLGDITGIGPEVTLKALAKLDLSAVEYLVIGDWEYLQGQARLLQLKLPLEPGSGPTCPGRVSVLTPCAESISNSLKPGAPAAARSALTWLTEGARQCLQGELSALVTAPVNKEAIIRSGHHFVGQTEWLSDLAGTDRTAMMLLGHDDHQRWLRVSLATTHVPLREVADRLTLEGLRQVIALTHEACVRLALPRQKIAVCGLNPHAGERGQFGREDMEVIQPAVDQARTQGLDVAGPLPADTVFYQAYHGMFDAVVAMYHDQGLPPLKCVAFETGVNWTLGLPFIRTSPDHGTAYDLAGRGIASPTSMLSALRLAASLINP